MSLAIRGLGTALPTTRLLQGEAAAAGGKYCAETDEQRHMLSVLYRQTEIETRHVVFEGEKFRAVMNGTATDAVWGTKGKDELGPTTGQRMERYYKGAVPIA